MDKWGFKYKFDINKYITPNTFNTKYKFLDRPNLIYFLGSIGFMATLHELILLYIIYPNKNIFINDMYWTSKCQNLKGIRCYFSEESLLVKILNNNKKITADTIIKNTAWIEDEKLYAKMNAVSVPNIWTSKSLLDPTKFDSIRKKINSLFNQIWKLNPEITEIVKAKLAILNNSSYIGIHIRMGDKIGKFDKKTTEADIPDLYKIPSIIETILKTDPTIDTIFIATDDDSAIDTVYDLLLESSIKKMYIITFSTEERKGYDQKKFNLNLSQEESYLSNIDFIIDFSALLGAKYYIGTLSSNITRFVIMSNRILYKNIYNIEKISKTNAAFIPKFYLGLSINHV
jgi:hypothetical protein